MTAPHVQEIWARTQGHLSQAAAQLPADLVESDDCGRLERYHDWIEQNELELALDELKGLGVINPVPSHYWVHLRYAALEMQSLASGSRLGAEDVGQES